MIFTWATKKKANGTYQAMFITHRYEQVDGKHYRSKDISSLVANNITIYVVLTLMIMLGCFGELLDVKGTFLHGDFDDAQTL